MFKRNPDLSEEAVPVARELHRHLTERGLHHVDVSLSAGLGRDYLRDLFRGKSKNPKGDELLKVSGYLRIPLRALAEQDAIAGDQIGGDHPYTQEEIALVDLWRLLSDIGRDRALSAIAKLITQFPRRK